MTAETLHPCARCARMQRTCCQRAEILVTSADVQRIAAHTGVSARESGAFVEHRAPADPSYLEDDPEDPRWKLLTVAADGSRRMLKRKPDGDCTFLGPQGCVLPTDVRPLVCRLYPWSYDQRGLLGEDADYCPTAALQPPEGRMALLLDLPAVVAEGWRSQLYAELESDLGESVERRRTGEGSEACASR
jgi:Fe-S-cluster containining protein